MQVKKCNLSTCLSVRTRLERGHVLTCSLVNEHALLANASQNNSMRCLYVRMQLERGHVLACSLGHGHT
jgi:hypothetical protein